MALLSFRGISTPSLTAQGEQRRSSYFNIRRGDPLEGEAEALVRKAVELAKGGDRQMLKFLLSTLLPRGRLITIDLPRMVSAKDTVEALARITRAVSEGMISPAEAAALAALINSFSNASASQPPSRDLTPRLTDYL